MSGIGSDIDNARQTFSSWDSCMSKAYCKWPVIIGIVIASLVVLSLVFCVARCLCFGLECCCGICSCCNACCPSPRNRRGDRRSGYNQAPSMPYNNYSYPGPNPYQPQAPMMYGAPAGAGYGPPPQQFATFETSSRKNLPQATVTRGPVNGDALPAMPTWADATTHHVEDDTPEPATATPERDAHSLEMEKEEDGIAMGAMTPAARNGRTGVHSDEQLEPMLGHQYSDAPHPSGTTNPYSSQPAFAGGDLGGQSQRQQYPPRQQQSQPGLYGQQQPGVYGGAYGSSDQRSPYGSGYASPPPREQPQPQFVAGQNADSMPVRNFSSRAPYQRSDTISPPSAPPSYHTRIPSVSDHLMSSTSPVSPIRSPPPQQQQQQQQQGYGRTANNSGPIQRTGTTYSASNYTYNDDHSTVYEPSVRNNDYNNNNYSSSTSPPPPPVNVQQAQQGQYGGGSYSPRTASRPRQVDPSNELFYGGANNSSGPGSAGRTPPVQAPAPQAYRPREQRWGERSSSDDFARRPVQGTWREA